MTRVHDAGGGGGVETHVSIGESEGSDEGAGCEETQLTKFLFELYF